MQNPSSHPEVVVAVDLGGTNTEWSFVSRDGQQYGQYQLPTGKYKEVKAFVVDLASSIQQHSSGFSVLGIGIGAPNGNYFNGTIENAPNLAWQGVVPLVQLVGQHTGLPCALTNDANAAAIGERYFGKAKGIDHFISVTIGTGLGSGIFVNGKVLYGVSGFAGEMGHTLLEVDGRPCNCGKRGCLEAYVSARGLVQTARELLAQTRIASPLAQLNGSLTAKAIGEAAANGDALAQNAFAITADYLGRQLADATALFSPEAIFLFGGVSRSGEYLLEPTRRAMDKYLLPIFKGTVRVELSDLGLHNAAILGAAALAWNEQQ